MLRPATLNDLDRLVEIETRCFNHDQISRRSFRHLITKGHGTVLVAEDNGLVVGEVIILLNDSTSLARVYSLGVDPAHRRKGHATALLRRAEDWVQAAGFFFIRLEVGTQNRAAIDLYTKMGFRQFGRWQGYYADDDDALRMEKRLRVLAAHEPTNVPYYEQTLAFSCGPAALMMAMKALATDLILDRGLEVRLWREATSVFMTAGHGGTTPFGLAVAAARRGFAADVYASGPRPLFGDSVRSDDKRAVIALTEEDYIAEMRECGIPLYEAAPDLAALTESLVNGAVPLVLISTWRLYRERAPHWVVLTGFDAEHVYIHDPWIDPNQEYGAVDKVNIPIRRDEFARMMRYGRAQTQTALIIRTGL